MSARLLTRITLPGLRLGWGLMDWGELTVEEMIGQYRRHAASLREQAAAIEDAADADFQVDIVRGSLKEEFVRNLQQGRAHD